jgi:hypothetical protein
MDVAADTLPDDVETLKAMILAEQAKLAAATQLAAEAEAAKLAAATKLSAEAEATRLELQAQLEENKVLEAERIRLGEIVDTLTAQAERYEHIIAQLRRLTFGKRSEQMDKDQLQLSLEDLQQGLARLIQADDVHGGIGGG